MEHINGKYKVELRVSDIQADNTFVWQLGTVTLWFKEGVETGNNFGMKELYKA